MRCLGCGAWSFRPLCGACRDLFLRPAPKIRRLPGGLEVLSLYAYDELEPLLLTKHLAYGWRLWRQMALESFKALQRLEEPLCAIPVDDHPTGGFSHSAILARALKPYGYRPLYGVLRARNRVDYAGKSLDFRLKNPRCFAYRGPGGIDAVLVDDIVTTGLTLQEAKGVLERAGVRVIGAIVLADVDRNG
ncbi:ComF family protein [Hydrogenimonas sp.]